MLDWQPTAPLDHLKKRAALLQQVRAFFAAREVMEVETPLLCHHSVTDPYIQSMPVHFKHGAHDQTLWLQTSPEYAMKRLLAAGSGPIYQLCKAFRQDEIGRFHNPEFTMLEWYRPGFDHHALMAEMDDLLQAVLCCPQAVKISYQALFQQHLGFDPHQAEAAWLANFATRCGLKITGEFDRDTWLQLLMAMLIEPKMGQERPCLVYDFPASQAALARIINGKAARFEVYYQGIELANGFYELQSQAEQRQRFENNNLSRSVQGLQPMAIDERFLAALQAGLPDCAGVALGLDRLIMLALQADRIADVISFDLHHA